MGLPLVTLAEYKTYAGIASTTQDAIISSLIPKVSQLVKSLCNRTFIDYVNDSKVEVKSGGTKLYLEEYPLLSVSNVEYSADFGASFISLVEFTDFVVDLEDSSISRTVWERVGKVAEWPKAINGYKITYTAGFEAIPEDLKVACLDLISYYMKSDSAIHSNKAVGSNTLQIEYVTKATLPAHIARILNLYTANLD